MPLFHLNGIVVGTLSPLLAGGRVTAAGQFEAKTFFGRLEQTRATCFSAVPTIYTMLCELHTTCSPTRLRCASRSAGITGQRGSAEAVRIALPHPDLGGTTVCCRDRTKAPSIH
ncbi:MAG TPA: AMP-binding protein [Mycobacterium sp.]|nr:AMP-binding protein [Mycobacterium sp.]